MSEITEFLEDNWWWITILSILIVLFVLKIVTMGRCNNKICLLDKTVIITGGNEGLGYQTALNLASRGCRLIIADIADCTKSIEKIVEITNNKNIFYKHINLASLGSVRAFAAEINSTEDRLDILICNAGIAALTVIKTSDNLDKTMQVNYFGHYLLTILLAEKLKKTKNSRVVFVSSLMAFLNSLTVQNLNSSAMMLAYQNSKLAVIIAVQYFNEKFKKDGVSVFSVHPGLVRTPLYYKFVHEKKYMFLKHIYYFGCIWLFAKTAEEGCQTAVFASTDPNVTKHSGGFLSDCKPFYKPRKAYDKQFCNAIIKATEELIQFQPSENTI